MEKEYEVKIYDAQILSREKNLADYFEETVKIGKQHELKPQTIASWIINKKPNIDQTLPASLIKLIVESAKVEDVDKSKLTETINKVFAENQKAVDDYKGGKENALMFLLGMTIREYGEKIDTNIVKNAILKSINN